LEILMETVLTWIHIVVAFLLIVLVLIQSGKGAEVGFSMGAGASQTLFGTGGGANLFTKITAVLATTFMLTSLTLTYIKAKESKESVFDSGMPTQSAPAEGSAPTSENTSGEAAKVPAENTASNEAAQNAPKEAQSATKNEPPAESAPSN
jgi:preprotein translocase subunit SecG